MSLASIHVTQPLHAIGSLGVAGALPQPFVGGATTMVNCLCTRRRLRHRCFFWGLAVPTLLPLSSRTQRSTVVNCRKTLFFNQVRDIHLAKPPRFTDIATTLNGIDCVSGWPWGPFGKPRHLTAPIRGKIERWSVPAQGGTERWTAPAAAEAFTATS
jgi:hypothetical protein